MKVVIVLGYNCNCEEIVGRVETGIAVFRKIKADYIVFSGGATLPNTTTTEAKFMAEYAIKRKIDKSRIILEEESLDTIGNAYFSRKILEKLNIKPELVVVVSSCYHMKRVRYIFTKVFGRSSNLVFEYCFSVNNRKMAELEEKKLKRALNFFQNLEDGDLSAIEEKLFTQHELYKTKPKI